MIFNFVFCFEYLKLKKENNYFKTICSIFIVIILLSVLSVFFEDRSKELSIYFYIFINLFLIFIGMFRFDKKSITTKIFFVSLFITFLGSSLTLLRMLGYLNPDLIFENSIFIAQFWSSLTVTSILIFELIEGFKKENTLKIDLIESKLIIEKDNIDKLNIQLKNEHNDKKSLKNDLFDKISEIDSILEISEKAFLCIGNDGKICQPISSGCENILGRKVEGEKASNIIFPNLTPGMKEFEELKNNLSKVFGADRTFFNAVQIRFPRKSLISKGQESKKLVLKISYEPIMDKYDNVSKLLCSIEDKTTESDELFTIKSESLRYSFLSDIFNMSNDLRKDIAIKLEVPIKHLYELINYLSNSSIEGENPLIVSRTVKYLLGHFKKEFAAESLEKHVDWYNKNIDLQIEFFEKFGEDNGYVSINSVVGVYDLVVNLLADMLQFCEELERFNVGINISDNIGQEIDETLEILSSQFSNLMEYTLLIRNTDVDKVTNNDLKKAVVNIKKLSKKNFETNIPLIYQKAKKLSLLYFVQGEHFKFSAFEDFAESVKLLPKPDLISASDLRYNLFAPYLETLKLKDEFM
tara:strand:- start:16 stop:1758 length:1743 start_codon:yes stop_codon:yes gene_type:complete